MKKLVELCKAKGLTVGCCESLTGGMFASMICDISGASAVFKGGLVTYSNECKINVAHVEREIIEQFGAVSAQCAESMAENTKKILNVDICFSFTGNAGPSVMEGKEAGLVYAGLVMENQRFVYEFHLDAPRNELRRLVCEEMCKNCIELLEKQ